MTGGFFEALEQSLNFFYTKAMELLQKLLLGGGVLIRSVRSLVIAVCLLVLMHLFVMTIIIVDGHSMDPTLQDHEGIVLNKLARTDTLQRGDIVVFHFPGDPKRNFIKRVTGLPGEAIQVKNGNLYVNNVALEESYLPTDVQTTITDNDFVTTTPVTVPESSYFLSGDNREKSNDSRAFGFVDQRFIIGTAMFSVWPTFEVYTRPYYPPKQ